MNIPLIAAVSNWNTLNQSVGSMSTSSMSPGALLFIGAVALLLAFIVVFITSIERYTKLWKALGWAWGTVKYTIYGAGICIMGSVGYIACTMIASAGAGINPVYIGYALLGYVAITLIGYAGSRIYQKILAVHTQYKTQTEEQPKSV